jgi:hypothetical protein
MSDRITIPRTTEKCVDALAEAGALITAKEWHRAAIVAAIAAPSQGRRSDLSDSSEKLTYAELAAKGIVGIRDKDTVARYRDAWCVYAGREAPSLGDRVDLNGLPDWPPNSKTSDTTPGAQKVRDVMNNPASVAKAMENPAFAEKVVERATPEARDNVRIAVTREDAEYTQGLIRSEKAREAEDDSRPTWLVEILNIPIRMEQAGSRERRLLRGDPAAIRWTEESTALLAQEVDRAQAILDWLRALPQMEAMTPESIIGGER